MAQLQSCQTNNEGSGGKVVAYQQTGVACLCSLLLDYAAQVHPAELELMHQIWAAQRYSQDLCSSHSSLQTIQVADSPIETLSALQHQLEDLYSRAGVEQRQIGCAVAADMQFAECYVSASDIEACCPLTVI